MPDLVTSFEPFHGDFLVALDVVDGRKKLQAGKARIIVDGDDFEISQVHVNDEYQGKGFGTYFMVSMLNFINERGHDHVYVRAMIDEKEKRRPFKAWRVEWYEKLGFVPIKVVRHYMLMEWKGP